MEELPEAVLPLIVSNVNTLSTLLNLRKASGLLSEPAADRVNVLLAEHFELDPNAWNIFRKAHTLIIRHHGNNNGPEDTALPWFKLAKLLHSLPDRAKRLSFALPERLHPQACITLLEIIKRRIISHPIEALNISTFLNRDVAGTLMASLPPLNNLALRVQATIVIDAEVLEAVHMMGLGALAELKTWRPTPPMGLTQLVLEYDAAEEPMGVLDIANLCDITTLKDLTLQGECELLHTENLTSLVSLTRLIDRTSHDYHDTDPLDVMCALPHLLTAEAPRLYLPWARQDHQQLPHHITGLATSRIYTDEDNPAVPGSLAAALPGLQRFAATVWGIPGAISAIAGHPSISHLSLSAGISDAHECGAQQLLRSLPSLRQLSWEVLYGGADGEEEIGGAARAVVLEAAGCSGLERLELVASAGLDLPTCAAFAAGECAGLSELRLVMPDIGLLHVAALLGGRLGGLRRVVVPWGVVDVLWQDLLELHDGVRGSRAAAAAQQQEERRRLRELAEGFVRGNVLAEAVDEAAGKLPGVAAAAGVLVVQEEQYEDDMLPWLLEEGEDEGGHGHGHGDDDDDPICCGCILRGLAGALRGSGDGGGGGGGALPWGQHVVGDPALELLRQVQRGMALRHRLYARLRLVDEDVVVQVAVGGCVLQVGHVHGPGQGQ